MDVDEIMEVYCDICRKPTHIEPNSLHKHNVFFNQFLCISCKLKKKRINALIQINVEKLGLSNEFPIEEIHKWFSHLISTPESKLNERIKSILIVMHSIFIQTTKKMSEKNE